MLAGQKFASRQVSISPTCLEQPFHAKLFFKAFLNLQFVFVIFWRKSIGGKVLLAQIPKAQKNTVKLSVFFALLGSTCLKAACKMLVKLTTGQTVLCKLLRWVVRQTVHGLHEAHHRRRRNKVRDNLCYTMLDHFWVINIYFYFTFLHSNFQPKKNWFYRSAQKFSDHL